LADSLSLSFSLFFFSFSFSHSGVYPDGERAQGGYASDKRLHQRFVFKIPDVISSAEAAPLLCAGVTVFAPLQRYKAGSGKRVAIVGVGGLGHLAVQFANKMGAEVIAFGHSDKKALAVKLGAQDYVSTKDEELMKKNFGTFDLILGQSSLPFSLSLFSFSSSLFLRSLFLSLFLSLIFIHLHSISHSLCLFFLFSFFCSSLSFSLQQ